MNRALRLTKWLAPAAALFALACALFAPAEAGVARRTRTPPQNVRAPQEEKPPEPEVSVVHGRVVYDDTTRPVRRARVMLFRDGNVGRSEHAALTDAGGYFAICCVRAGAYYAYVDVPGVLSPVGFVSLETMRASSGSLEIGEGRPFFDLIEVDGKQDVDVTVHARRGASIAGRVAYADGDPAVNAQVSLLRRSADGRVQRYMSGANVPALSGLRTDDRGMFRLSGLPPGEYLIGVNEAVNHGGAYVGAGSMMEGLSEMFRGVFTQQLLMTFYPSATSLKEAGVVKVGAGEERDDVDIRIPERDLHVVTGVVRARRGGRPVKRASVTIARRGDPLAPSAPPGAYYDDSESGQNSTTTNDEGRWWLVEVPDGAYTITVKPPEEYEGAPAAATTDISDANANNANAVAGVTNMNTSEYRPPRRKRSYAPTRVNLDVSGGDVTEFVVEVAEGARVTGTVTVEGEAAPRYGYVSLLRVGEESDAADFARSQSGSLGGGGRFAVEGLPAGRYFLQPSIDGVGISRDTTYLKSITWSGKDLLREPLALAESAAAEGVRIVYGRNPATLNVTVRAAARREPSGLFVVLLPLDFSTWSPLAPPVFCTTNEAGACSISAAPGEYRVLAMRTPTSPAAYEQEVRRRAASAPRVTLRGGEAGRVELDAPGN